ncbi:MAG: hypothetical protein AB7J35_14980 [Dehalococcoidia bacterium]
MSQLQKRIQRLQRRDGPAIGFGRVTREQPRAMALIATARSASEAKAAIDAEVDAVLIEAGDASSAAKAMDGVASEKLAVGALLASLNEADAEALRNAKCDFVISPLETTDSAAVDTEKMGQAIRASQEMEDNTLRAIGPLGFDGLFVQRSPGAMTLGQQLGLVRLASFASTGLIVTVDADASVGELRVLRDSGTLAVVAPVGTSADGLKKLSETLKAVPAPKKGKREGNDIALVPSSHAASEDEGEEEDGDE